MRGQVGIGMTLYPPWDRDEGELIDSNPDSIWRFCLPIPICGPLNIRAYTSSEKDDEEEVGSEIAALHELLAAL